MARSKSSNEPGGQTGAHSYSFGVYYPSGYTVGVLDNQETSRRCLQELRDAGIPPSDVECFTGDEALQIDREQRRHRGLLRKIVAAFPSDEHSMQDDYLRQANTGAYFVAFHCRDEDQERRAREVLAHHHAHDVRHYGRWTWEEVW